MKTYFRKTILTGAAVVIVCCLFSCHKNKQAPAVYINENVKNYFNYQQGTYWIFYDSLNNHIDSLYVLGNTDYKPFWDGITATEKIEIGIIDAYDSLRWGLNLSTPAYSEMYISDSKPTGDQISDLLTEEWPFKLGEFKYSKGPTNGPIDSAAYKCTFFLSYTIGNIVYDSVYEITFSQDLYHDTYYINGRIGFLSVELNDQFFHKNLYLLRNKTIK